MESDEKKPPIGGELKSFYPLGRVLCPAPSPPYMQSVAALVEWENGEHTHLALEVMASDGRWEPLAAVSLKNCLAPDIRPQLRQFPLFRLAWYGQWGDPSNTPQSPAPEQASFVSSEATTRP